MEKIEVHGEAIIQLGNKEYVVNAPGGVTIKEWIPIAMVFGMPAQALGERQSVMNLEKDNGF
jgi:hypothetical protein